MGQSQWAAKALISLHRLFVFVIIPLALVAGQFQYFFDRFIIFKYFYFALRVPRRRSYSSIIIYRNYNYAVVIFMPNTITRVLMLPSLLIGHVNYLVKHASRLWPAI